MFKLAFEKARGARQTTNHRVTELDTTEQLTRDQIANIHWIIEKAREFQKNIYFCFIDYAKAFDCVDHNQLWKILEETCMQVRKQQLELDMEQQTGSK